MARGSFDNLQRSDLAVGRERAVLVKVLLNGQPEPVEPLAELRELARSAGAEVVDWVLQRRKSYEAATCIGKGKLEEIRQRIEVHEADVVIFDNDLSPSQIREIEAVVERKVIDRSELILDIFASRARTAEARLQVELAQLEYTAPRLRGMWTHLERIAGAGGGNAAGAVGGIGTRGPGERQIEIDRRIVGRRISFLKDKLAEIDRRRVREVRSRSNFFQVSLVGYTNAGKSTLLNALTGAGAVAADQLFMTLDTLTRKWSLGGGAEVLLSDTVGFIRDLPHHLVASFRATLAEALHADLLLHVVDAASAEAFEQIAAVNEVLASLGADEIATLLVLNKADVAELDGRLTLLEHHCPGSVSVSAKTGAGLEGLAERVAEAMRGAVRRLRLRLPAGDGKALNFLERFAAVHERRFEGEQAELDVSISADALAKLRDLAGSGLEVG